MAALAIGIAAFVGGVVAVVGMIKFVAMAAAVVVVLLLFFVVIHII